MRNQINIFAGYTCRDVVTMLNNTAPMSYYCKEEIKKLEDSMLMDETIEPIFYNENSDSSYSTLLINPHNPFPLRHIVWDWMWRIQYDEENAVSSDNIEVVSTIMRLTLNRELNAHENRAIKKALREIKKENWWYDYSFKYIAANDDHDFDYAKGPVHRAFYLLSQS